jgi:ubiquinone/menaquinone biosynthesis C-methylase UbiE
LTLRKEEQLFDDWPEKYDAWFATPIGALVRNYERELLLDLLSPKPEEVILDAGCGTGVFTRDFLAAGSKVTGLDISLPMLRRATQKSRGFPLRLVVADMTALPFPQNFFDKVVSVTALEFIKDGGSAVRELFRVTKVGGAVVVATLNRVSPWAQRRKEEASKGHPIFKRAIFRSPDELLALAPAKGIVRTAIHFQKDDDPDRVPAIERDGQQKGMDTGAFVAARWTKK